ncbi:hypothetical protein [Halolamina sp. C58]|uniref:hypothetical protein n=1 Tax=Halolamina sp. C58 TaxID=3421640 RepID=UPI003EBD7B1D
MVLDTTADVDTIEAVEDRDGAVRPPANADLQDQIIAALAELNDHTGNAEDVFAAKLQPATDGDILPSHAVDDGSEVMLLADPANAGPIYVGPTGSATVPLSKGNGITFGVENTELLEAMASNAGDVLHVIGEESA